MMSSFYEGNNLKGHLQLKSSAIKIAFDKQVEKVQPLVLKDILRLI